MALSRIMIIVDPTLEGDQPAFTRALDSALMTGARLHLYACLAPAAETSATQAATRHMQDQLETMVQRAARDGVDVSTELEINADWRKQAVAAAARCSASMIFKTYIPHTDVQREIRTTHDWTLLRLAPCPVLLVKNIRDWKHRRVLAAVNSQATDEAHIKLNHQIISFTQQFTDAYGSDAHVVTAYQDRNKVPATASLADEFGISAQYVHVGEGKAADVIRQTADEIEADLILIGTVGRSGIKGTIVGNTSERLLDHTQSDLLVLN
jgi:universal stress protein E